MAKSGYIGRIEDGYVKVYRGADLIAAGIYDPKVKGHVRDITFMDEGNVRVNKVRQAAMKAMLEAVKHNPFDWEGCMDKVSRQPGIYSPGGVCATAERRKVMGNPKRGKTARYYPPGTPMMFDGNDNEAGQFGFFPVEVVNWNAVPEGYDNRGLHILPKALVRKVRTGKEFLTGTWLLKPTAKSNPHNPDELETVFSPESVASKLTLATAVPGAAVAMTAIELAHAVDAGLVDETAAVLMRPVEEVAEAVIGNGRRNPGDDDERRTELRLKQDFLLMLTDMRGINRSMRLSENSPVTLSQLSKYIYPQWEYLVDKQIREFASDSRVGVPNFKQLARKRNPSTDADTMYESFHGQPPTETVEVVEELREHGHLATLGTLVELKLQSMAGKDISIEWTKDNPYLASNEHGTQLYIVGGDQTVDLKALGMAGDKWEREHMVLGVCHEVTYRTRKGFDKFRLVDYYHNLGEETGVQPMLAYDTVNDKLSIVGGQYAVRPEGIVN